MAELKNSFEDLLKGSLEKVSMTTVELKKRATKLSDEESGNVCIVTIP